MPQNEKYQQLKKLISKGRIKEVFKQLPALLSPDTPQVSDLIVLEAQFWQSQQDENRGVINNDERNLAQTQLSQSLLAILNQLENKIDQPTAGQLIFSDTIRNIRALLIDPGRLSHAFSRLEVLIEERFLDLMPLLTPIWSDFNTNRNDFIITQIIKRETYMLAFRRTVMGMEELLVKLVHEEAKTKGQGVELGSDLARFNCDRKKILRRFIRSFEENEERKVAQHFYLLSHQKYGQSESLAKRLITHMYQQYDRVKYGGFGNIPIQKIDLEDDDDMEDGKYSLRKGFNRGLKPEVRGITELLEKADQDYTQFYSFGYLPFVLQINMFKDSWKKTGLPIMKWFATTFCQSDKRGSKIPVFFIIIKFKNAKISAKEQAPRWRSLFTNKKKAIEPLVESSWDILDELQHGLPDYCTLLPPLMRVIEDDLYDWYSTFESNERRREEKVQAMIQQLGANTQGWHMADVENVLNKIIEEQLNVEHNI